MVATKLRLQKGSEAVNCSATDVEGKMHALSSVLIARISYPNQIMPWNEDQPESLDALVRGGTRHILDDTELHQ